MVKLKLTQTIAISVYTPNNVLTSYEEVDHKADLLPFTLKRAKELSATNSGGGNYYTGYNYTGGKLDYLYKRK